MHFQKASSAFLKASLFLSMAIFASGLNSSWGAGKNASQPSRYFSSPDIQKSRQIKTLQNLQTSRIVAAKTPIGRRYKNMLEWMKNDLKNYLNHFDEIFNAKLRRIEKHEKQRLEDLEVILSPFKAKLNLNPNDETVLAEIKRLTDLHQPHGYIENYHSSQEFLDKYVGPKGKLLKSSPSAQELLKMDKPGMKTLYVDTWAVPFFNTGTQSRDEAFEGVKAALAEFEALKLNQFISVLQFTELMALFARPEFSDVRRYKLFPFPSEAQIERYGLERNDAQYFGSFYPEENLFAVNKTIGIDPISSLFGERIHLVGLISHSTLDVTADGRIFTGPADFLEHDYAHAYFNLGKAIPGTIEDWQAVYTEFQKILDKTQKQKLKRMMSLTYYHFTHESGFKILHHFNATPAELAAFENERAIMHELIKTRYHYDFILAGLNFQEGYAPFVDQAFLEIGNFFKAHFLRIQKLDQLKLANCNASLVTVKKGTQDEIQ